MEAYFSNTGIFIAALIFLIDDLPAELDAEHCKQFIQMIQPLQSQFWLTAVNSSLLAPLLTQQAVKKFHVEHGLITQTD